MVTLEEVSKDMIWWKNLTQEELACIPDSKDHALLSLIYGIPQTPENHLKTVASAVRPLDQYLKNDYMEKQKGWLNFFEYCFLQNKHYAKPSDEDNSDCACRIRDEEGAELCKSNLTYVFRLYFYTKNPQKMTVVHQEEPLWQTFCDELSKLRKANLLD